MRHLPTAPHRLTVLALASLTLCTAAWSQNSADAAGTEGSLPSIGVTATPKRQQKASIAGLGDGPAWQQPAQALTLGEEALKDAQVSRLADLTNLDASTTDSYNTVGYWDYLTVRGFTLDNAYNYRREGLPINAETRILLDNKAGVELLKGTSGMQSGVSAPGGLVNLLVKRPEGRVRSTTVSVDDAGQTKASVDLSDRFGERREFGARLNASVAKLNTHIDNTEGHSRLLALAGDWRVSPDTLIEAEVEYSWLSQPSVPGLSLLGTRLPSAREFSRNLNLNNQPWTTPVQMEGTTGTLRWKQNLAQRWKSTVTYGEQHLRSNDRAAFPFGWHTVTDDYYFNFKSDGTYDLYDYRSDDERRITRSLLAQLDGQIDLAGMRHELRFAALRSLFHSDLNAQAYNWSGVGSLYAPYAPLPADPTLAVPGTNRAERSTELSVQDTIHLSPEWTAWLGLRHTRLQRHSVQTDGAQDTRLAQNFNAPWAAVGWTFAPQTQVYLSWGEGVEAAAAPRNASGLSNPGQVLPALKSRQTELGIKGQYQRGRVQANWGTNLFEIRRPQAVTVDTTYRIDGDALHRGVEGFWQGRVGAWGLGASAMVLHTERRHSAMPDVNGKQAPNVPEQTLKLSGSYTWATPMPVTVQTDVVHEGRRAVEPANTTHLPAWTRVDLSLRAVQGLDAGRSVTWRLAVANLFDKRAWREAPSMFGGHTYLFPLAQRTLMASAQVDF